MLKQWIAILFVAAILVSRGQSQDTECPKGCTCKDQSLELFTMICKSLNLKNKPSELITNFEIFQSEEPLHFFENVFTGIGLERVNTITISNSSVIAIEKNAFKELTALNTIRIMHTNTSYIHPDTFVHNINLGKLYLHNNPLKQIESIKSDSIRELIISHCNLNTVKVDMFQNMPNLEMIDLRGNNIKKIIPGTFDSLSSVSEIHLEDNQISHFSDGIFDKIISLESLYLDNNPIVKIPNIKLEDLDSLSLRSCKINSLEDDTFTELGELSNLDLSNNQITKISSKALYTLTSLSTINLSGNDIREVADHIFYNNAKLEKIIFDNNKNMGLLPANGFINKDRPGNSYVYHFSCQNCGLRALSEKTFSTMPDLVTLVLSHNKIYDIRTGVFNHLTNLKELDLSYNQIGTMDDNTFKYNEDLHTLNLAGNPIKTLHPSIFKFNIKLQKLDLNSCGLSSLWTGSKKERLNSIQNLNISDNKITLITKKDVEVTNNLKSLDMSGNDLICTESYKTLVEYLTDNRIQDTEYRTHEEISNDDETVKEMTASMGRWKEQAKMKCPSFSFVTKDIDENIPADVTTIEYVEATDKNKSTKTDEQYDEEDDDDEDDEEDDEDDDDDEDEDDEDETITHADLPEESDIAMHVRSRFERYSYLWLTLVFLGVLLVTLGVVANLILFIIRRRQMIEVPRINIRHISKMKKNSGLVYQQLSEERDGVKTPVLSRFIPIPSVHTPNAPNFV